MSEWKQIETAPRDGTEIFGWASERGGRPADSIFFIRWTKRYTADGGVAEMGWNINLNITHWQPLPEPPQS